MLLISTPNEQTLDKELIIARIEPTPTLSLFYIQKLNNKKRGG
jgi:hypothetical protein